MRHRDTSCLVMLYLMNFSHIIGHLLSLNWARSSSKIDRLVLTKFFISYCIFKVKTVHSNTYVAHTKTIHLCDITCLWMSKMLIINPILEPTYNLKSCICKQMIFSIKRSRFFWQIYYSSAKSWPLTAFTQKQCENDKLFFGPSFWSTRTCNVSYFL